MVVHGMAQRERPGREPAAGRAAEHSGSELEAHCAIVSQSADIRAVVTDSDERAEVAVLLLEAGADVEARRPGRDAAGRGGSARELAAAEILRADGAELRPPTAAGLGLDTDRACVARPRRRR